jgi:hypothetical protein
MSYDLAVWEGDQPADNDEAYATYRALYERYIAGVAAAEKPTPAISGYIKALLAGYPEDEDGSPWASGPLGREAAGPLTYFGLTWSRCAEMSDRAASLAAAHGLVCYDPQQYRLRPGTPAGSSDDHELC